MGVCIHSWIQSKHLPLTVELPKDAQPNRNWISSWFNDRSKHEVKVNVMDLAGQVEYYVSHQLLLSDVLGMYVIVAKYFNFQGNILILLFDFSYSHLFIYFFKYLLNENSKRK